MVTTEGPLLVMAAAGSGKTRVITRRVAWLVTEVGIPPWQVLAITFTNKAAGEMRQRVAERVSEPQGRALTVCTFHSLCARLLREFADAARLPADYSIYDTVDQKRAVRQAMRDLDISTGNFTPDSALGTISNAKNELVDAEAFAASAGNFYDRTIARVYAKYQEILTRNQAVDFDDLLMKFADLLRRDKQAREELQQRFAYVLIDEYQDTNHAQFVIARLLVAGHRNLCVVGDPDQSIYGWRGANIRNILEFEKHFADAKVIALGQNWRSTPQILLAADALIRNNRQRRHKPLFTDNAAGANLELVRAAHEEHEAELVVEFLRARRDEGTSWSGMAVFYRINALSRVIEDLLMRSSIPYQVARGTAFYDRKEIKDAIAYLKALLNPADQVALERVINTPTRGIGKTSLDHVSTFASMNDMTMWQALGDPRCLDHLTARAAGAIRQFVAMVNQWRDKLEADGADAMFIPSVRDVIEMIIQDSGLEAHYRKEDDEKLANLYELVTAGQRFDDEYGEQEAPLIQRVRDYLEAVALVSDVDAVDDESGAVTLMTLHAAKGLEFDAVAMIGLEEGLLPHSRSLDDPAEMEEERRLCFVGITRARQHLRMTHARYRAIRGYRERTIPSQFLRELPEEVIDEQDRAGERDDFDASPPRRGGAKSRAAGTAFPEGCIVRHPQFGLGVVEQLSGAGDNARAKVRFNTVGAKTLILRYAHLEKVSD